MGYTVEFCGYSCLNTRRPTGEEIKELSRYNRELHFIKHKNLVGVHKRKALVYEVVEGSQSYYYDFNGSWGCGTWQSFLDKIDKIASQRGILLSFEMIAGSTYFHNHEDSRKYYTELKELYELLMSETESKVDTVKENNEDNEDSNEDSNEDNEDSSVDTELTKLEEDELYKLTELIMCFEVGCMTEDGGTFVTWV